MKHDKLKEVIAHILGNYPIKNELSNARLTKMVYLSDWKHAIEHGPQITTIEWYFDNYGPFVRDVGKTIDKYPELFARKTSNNMFGGGKTLFSITDEGYQPDLGDDEKASIDHVMDRTKPMSWSRFVTLVYSTYPVLTSSRYSTLDLVAKAKEYNAGPRYA